MSSIHVTYSSELMRNYLHAEVVSAQKKFEALQSSDGHSLLFAIDTEGAFNVLCESSGKTSAGWSRVDLSGACLKRDFPGQQDAICRTFEAGQSAADGTVSLAMVISSAIGDHLYLSLGNSNADTGWTASPEWQQYAFDATSGAASKVVITNVFLCEAGDGAQYTIVDILRDPDAATKDVRRFYIDPAKDGGCYWHLHDLPVDIEADGYASCTGRLPSGMVDGIYTAGKAGNKGQLVFTPVINIYGDAPPMPTRLNLPMDAIADTLAAARNLDQSTDLYVTSGGALYYFASSAQHDGAQPLCLLQHDLLHDVRRLVAYHTSGQVYLWGLNGADQVFYLTCPASAVATPAAWSHPVPILSGVAVVSPYVNCANYGNTIFAVGDGKLFKMTQSPQSGLWSTQALTLPAEAASAAPHSFSSYTTRILATDDESQAVPGSALNVSAQARGAFFINNLYYILDTTPVTIHCDGLGSLTIIESVENTIHGTRLSISLPDGPPLQINPMDGPMNKVAQLNSVNSLQTAAITGSDGNVRPLVRPGTSADDLQAVANANGKLMTAYLAASNGAPRSLAAGPRQLAQATRPLTSLAGSILVDVGDIFKWLESGVESVVDIVEDAATGIWHFVAKIAGKVYQGALDCVEAVVGAVKWAFNAIKTAIEDLIAFLEFLFAWKDILITHEVMKRVFKLQVGEAIASLANQKSGIRTAFDKAQTAINDWAGIPDFGSAAGAQQGQDTYGMRQNAPANLGLHHYQGNVSGAVTAYAPATAVETVFQDLLTLLEAEGDTLSAAYTAVKTDIVDQFNSLTVSEIIKRFAAIMADTLLQSAENIIIATIDVFVQLASGFMDMLDAPLEIPVLSWLYKDLTGNSLSVLDVVCLVAAIPATIVHKAACGHAPFARGDAFTEGLMGAASFADMRSAFHTVPSTLALRDARMTLNDAAPVLDEGRLKVFGFVTGLFAATGSVVLVVTSGIQRTLDIIGLDNARPKTLATIACVGNIAYVSPNIATFINTRSDNWYQQMNNSLTGISIIKGFAAIPFSSSSSPVVKYGFPAIESLINLIWNIPVIMNIVDNHNRWDNNYKSLIPESIGNFAFNAGGVLELPITLLRDPESKVITSAVQYGLMLVYGLCMPVAGGIYEFEKNQDHS